MKRVLSIAFIFFVGVELNAQQKSLFVEEEEKIAEWLTPIINQAANPNLKKNTVSFNTQGYVIEGYFSKGKLTSGELVVFYNTENNPIEVLKGRVSYVADRLVVTGVWHKNPTKDGPILYGSFYVSNTPQKGMIYKEKKAGSLIIQPNCISFYCGTYDDQLAILEIGNNSYIYLGDENSYLCGKIKTYVLSDRETYDFAEYLTLVKDDVCIRNTEGEIFTGTVLPEKKEDGKVVFHKRQGICKKENKNTGEIEGSQEVVIEEPYIIYKTIGAYAGDQLDNGDYYIKNSSLFQWDSCWTPEYYYKYCDKIRIKNKDGEEYTGTAIINYSTLDHNKTSIASFKYKDGTCQYLNGDSFDGLFADGRPAQGVLTYYNGNSFDGKFLNGLPSQGTITYNTGNKYTGKFSNGLPSQGSMTYKNGDRFEGKMINGVYGTIYTDGTTFFIDGSKKKGNWIKEYNLTDIQLGRISYTSNPTEARKLAEKYKYNNDHIVYTSEGFATPIQLFNPSGEKREAVWCAYMTYEKSTNTYTCRHWEESDKIDLQFVVDKKGNHTRETVFENGEPKYINYLTWYNNGIIESIKSYLYDNEQLYLTCNFFSDGKLRSAYKYEIGNNGKVILRKSKESHPSLGGYTSKLYDLNGNFERNIDWNIGNNGGLLGTKQVDLGPSPLDLSDFSVKPSE